MVSWLWMDSPKEAAIFVPVKGTSERIPSKNLKLLDGKPLFLHTLEKLSFLSERFNIVLDTESSKVAKMASYIEGVSLLARDPSLATNKTDGNKLFMNEVRHCRDSIVAQHLCTSPFIGNQTIIKAIDALKEKKGNPNCQYDSAFLVERKKLYMWENSQPSYDLENIPNSVDLPFTTVETMGFYAVKREAALKTNRRIGQKPFLMEASPLEAFDVNWPQDFEMAQLIAAGIREGERKLLDNLALLMSSALLSDLLDDLGFVNQVIKSLDRCSIQGKKFLGPAKTLKLKAISIDDNSAQIYDALDHYETIVNGDVICVENEVPQYAFFGELNANLAIRQGVRGVVVGGKTRDNEAVRATGLPVYSSGYTCQDVRNRAVLESINSTVFINKVKISPGDYIFADAEGVVVLPKKWFSMVVAKVIEKLGNEKSIITDIAKGVDTSKLTKYYGMF